MAHPPPYPETGDETDAPPGHGLTAGTPRWVVVVGIAVAIGLVVLVVVLHLTGSIGPGAH
jgi:hypothetical protein